MKRRKIVQMEKACNYETLEWKGESETAEMAVVATKEIIFHSATFSN